MTIPLVHQVLTLHGAFECSICRRRYKTREAAENCLERCFFASIAKAETVTRKQGRQGTVYECNWCHRRYADQKQAHACANLCQESRIKKFRQELEIFRYELPERKPLPVKKPPPLLRHPLARKPPFSGRHHGLAHEPDTHIEVHVPTTPAEASPSHQDLADAGVEMVASPPSFDGVELVNDTIEPVATQGEKQRQFLKSGRPPVTKFGVKYRCNLCRKNYFEMKEAERCFNSHP